MQFASGTWLGVIAFYTKSVIFNIIYSFQGSRDKMLFAPTYFARLPFAVLVDLVSFAIIT